MPSCFSWFSWTPNSTGPCTSYWANSPSWTWCWFPQWYPNGGWLLDWQEFHLPCWLWVADLFLPHFGRGWVLPPSSHVLWPLCRYLPPTEIPSPHELANMPENDFGVLVPGCSWWTHAGCCYPDLFILQFTWDRSFLLWSPISGAFGLCWHVSLWVCHVHMLCVNAPGPHLPHPDFL